MIGYDRDATGDLMYKFKYSVNSDTYIELGSHDNRYDKLEIGDSIKVKYYTKDFGYASIVWE